MENTNYCEKGGAPKNPSPDNNIVNKVRKKCAGIKKNYDEIKKTECIIFYTNLDLRLI